MEIDQNYLAKFAKKPDRRDLRSEREYYLNLFIEKINTQRKQENKWAQEQNEKLRHQGKEPIYKMFPPVAPRNVVFKVSHLKTPALKDFYYKCEKAENFSRCFFGSLKIPTHASKKS